MQGNLDELLVRKKLAGYLSSQTSLKAFRRWFVPATWDVEEWAPKNLQELVHAIKLRLAEYSSGHWTESDLRRLLSVIVGTYYVGARSQEQRGSSTKSITVKVGHRSSAIRLVSPVQTRSLQGCG
jgi:hypothetical protein